MVTQLAVNTLGKNAAAAVADVQFRDPHTCLWVDNQWPRRTKRGFMSKLR